MTPSAEQSLKIQTLRGIAIIAVVLIHCMPHGIIQVWCRPFVNFAVGLFLFLSGMLSSADRWQPGKRLKKILIPYSIWTFVYVLASNYQNPLAIPFAFIKGLLTGSSAAVMYYVFVYCELTLLIPAIDKLARSRYWWVGLLISPIEIIVFRTLPLLLGIEIGNSATIVQNLSCIGWFIYYYLGYLLGNDLMKINLSNGLLKAMLVICVVLQMIEGYWYYLMGVVNCGSQLKLTAVLTGCVFVFLIFDFISSDSCLHPKALILLGDCSFGIFFSHLAVMAVLSRIPHYSTIAPFPVNAAIATLTSLSFVLVGKRVLGKYGKYLALS